MNNIDTSQIFDPTAEQPFTGLSLAFLQSATSEMLKGLARAFVGDNYYNNYPCAIAGCKLNGPGSTMFNGFIFWNNEIYYTAGMSGLTSPPFTTGANVPVFTELITNDGTADPVEFTDGVLRNVHKIRRLTLTAGLSGSGLFNMSQLLNAQNRLPTTVYPAAYTTTTAGVEVVTGSQYTTPAYGTRNWLIRFTGQISWFDIAAAANGGTILLRCAGGTLTTNFVSFTPTLGGNAQYCPITVEYLALAVPAGSLIEIWVQRLGASNVQVNQAALIIEEKKKD